MINRRFSYLIGACAVAFALVPAIAQAATERYHPAPEARDFATSIGGWTEDSEAGGICALVLTCPTVTNSFQSGDGAEGTGDGYIRTELGLLLGVAGNVSGIFNSPAFVYNGVGGGIPDTVEFDLARRADVASFLSVVDNEASYSVDLINQNDAGASVNLVPTTPIENAEQFSQIQTVSVDPEQLEMGESYAFQITSRFAFGVDLLPGSTADYDNVVLRAETSSGARRVTCDDLNAQLRGTQRADTLNGGPGTDLIRGFKGNDKIDGMRGADCLFGNNDDDTIEGGGGSDEIHGNGGDDTITDPKGRNTLLAGTGNDNVQGGRGNDTIKGNSGKDTIRGGGGRDTIVGGSGKDRIFGDSGKDRINVKGNGKDRVKCGSGRDRVIASKKDRIAGDCERVRIR